MKTDNILSLSLNILDLLKYQLKNSQIFLLHRQIDHPLSLNQKYYCNYHRFEDRINY